MQHDQQVMSGIKYFKQRIFNEQLIGLREKLNNSISTLHFSTEVQNTIIIQKKLLKKQ